MGPTNEDSRSTSDYENLSNGELNEIMTSSTYNANQPAQRRNIFVDKDGNNLMHRVSLNPAPAPVPPPAPPPIQLLTQFKRLEHQQINRPLLPPSVTQLVANQPVVSSSETDGTDVESVMSCQLITSASLLLNRGPQFQVREARRVFDNNIAQAPQVLAPNHNNPPAARRQMQPFNSSIGPNRNMPPLNPRHFLTNQTNPQLVTHNDEYTQTIGSATLTAQAVNNVPNNQEDASKPPPMETAI